MMNNYKELIIKKRLKREAKRRESKASVAKFLKKLKQVNLNDK
jgi:hypothetical protein